MTVLRWHARLSRLWNGGHSLAEGTVVHTYSPPYSYSGRVTTPALVYDQSRLRTLAAMVRRIREQSRARVLYAIKACAFLDVLQMLAPSVDGFAVSSLFEARMVHDMYPHCPAHLTTPGLRDHEIDELADLCGFVVFNSETQLCQYGPRVHPYASVGLRVNTQISHVQDARYDPARRRSQLGIPLGSLRDILASSPVAICGLHFHTNADSEDLTELEANVVALAESVRGINRLDWVNFGGGYLFDEVPALDPLERCVDMAKRDIAHEVYVEPGAGLVRPAGYLVASVVDVFDRHGTRVAILDTSVNHLPEVLEFGYQPDVHGSTPDGGYEYLLAGSSCLAGDAFGKYKFDSPLTIGTTVTFTEAGAYAQAKSHRFNGINLPSVWITSGDGTLTERQTLDYKNYLQHWMPNV